MGVIMRNIVIGSGPAGRLGSMELGLPNLSTPTKDSTITDLSKVSSTYLTKR